MRRGGGGRVLYLKMLYALNCTLENIMYTLGFGVYLDKYYGRIELEGLNPPKLRASAFFHSPTGLFLSVARGKY
jgi:hypothetical protein